MTLEGVALPADALLVMPKVHRPASHTPVHVRGDQYTLCGQDCCRGEAVPSASISWSSILGLALCKRCQVALKAIRKRQVLGQHHRPVGGVWTTPRLLPAKAP